VSYNEKHNEANGEENKDGESHNRSWNSGVEGPTDDQEVLALRARQQRNFLATLLVSQGVPMLLHGDELGRTQQGNNNGYAQDSELTWIHWDDADLPLTEFTAAVSRLRREHPLFRRSRFFNGRPVRRGEGEPLPDLVWLAENGESMQPDDWDERLARTVGVFFNGQGIRERDSRGQPIIDVSFLIYFNADPDATECVLPAEEFAARWEVVIDTAGVGTDAAPLDAGSTLSVAGRSVVVLRAFEESPAGDHSVAASLAGATP